MLNYILIKATILFEEWADGLHDYRVQAYQLVAHTQVTCSNWHYHASTGPLLICFPLVPTKAAASILVVRGTACTLAPVGYVHLNFYIKPTLTALKQLPRRPRTTKIK